MAQGAEVIPEAILLHCPQSAGVPGKTLAVPVTVMLIAISICRKITTRFSAQTATSNAVRVLKVF